MPDPENLLQTAHRLDRAGQWEGAAKAYEGFLQLEPGDAGAWADYGGLLMVAGRSEAARQACHRSLRIDPKHPGAMINLGSLLLGLGRWNEAEGLFRRVLAMDPRRNDARLALSHGLMNKGDMESARTVLDRAIAQDPGSLEAHRLLCRVLVHRGEGHLACREIERRYSFLGSPSGPEVQLELSHMALLFGEMPKGWQFYEGRLSVPIPNAPQPRPDHIRWNGEAFVGRTLLVDHEQGLGDTLMFVRYAPQVKALGGRVVLSVQRPLAELVATCQGIDEVVPLGDPLPPFDLHVPLLSLPWVFRTDLESIPAQIPYLSVPARVPNRRALTHILDASAGKLRIGLAWAGNPIHLRDAERSMLPGLLAPLAVLPDVAWHSFHFGGVEEVPFPGITPLAPHLSHFSDSAFALDAMDLVITVDTALAHLAGALGIPTLLLLHAFPDWRWLLGREDSPWYPTLRIYRQPVQGDWETVVQRVLTDLTGQGSSHQTR